MTACELADWQDRVRYCHFLASEAGNQRCNLFVRATFKDNH